MRAAIIAGTRSKSNHILNLQDNNNNNNHNNHDNLNPNTPPPPPPPSSSSPNSCLDATPTSSRPRPRPPSAKPPLRPPLRARDRNAMMRASTSKASTPLIAKSGNANPNMPPYDHKPNHNASRPLMPTLSASAKVPHRPAITPRVAGSAPAPHPNPTTTPLPLSRRTPRAAAGGAGGGGGDVDTPTATASKEDLSTPVSAFLNTNITPRSGSRKSRVDSANTTPTGTPNGTSIESPRVVHDGPGLGISGMDKDLPKRPTVSFNTAASEVGGGYPKTSTSSATADSKFFFASDARPAPPPKPVLQSKAPSSFFYANGGSIPPPAQSSNSSAVGTNTGEERGQPKFFHANGTPDIQLSPSPYFAPPRPGSAVSSSSRVTTARAPTSSPSALSPPQRPLSPSKLSQQASVASLRNTPPLPSPVLPSQQTGGRAPAATNSSVAAQRASIEISSRAVGHRRSESTGSIGSSLRKVSGGSSVDTGPPSTPLNVTTAGLVSTPEEAPDLDSKDGISSGLPQSPIKSGQSIEQLNELAASARRERKVLDLEITNSSLAAINRTLEREMRKQTAELRRYRRLSRSGRLSIATATSLRSSTGTLSSIGGSIEGNGLSDMSEEEGDSEMSDDETDSMDDGSLSPDAMAESDLRHLKKDEKRLQLDLSKHQQLLIDSQKMNQGLKRCLEWTETLINEGKRALEYHVRVSDVELGGRVLAPDEVEEAGDNEGMSEIGARLLREARTTVVHKIAPWGAEGRDDRDSGIELDGTQRETIGPPPPLPQ